MALKIDHITLLVSSLKASMPYYEKLLTLVGFLKLSDHVLTDEEGFYFQFNEAKLGSTAYERFGAGMNHLGFSAPSIEFVKSVQDRMREASFEAPEIQEFDGATALFMKDPDGIRFEVSYYKPGTSVTG